MNYPNIKVFTTNFKVINTNMETYTYCKKNKRIVLLDAYKDFYLNKIFLRAGNTFIHISCFDKVGLFNEKLKYYEDLEFDIRLLDAFQLVYSPEVTFIYSRNYSSLSIAKQDFNNGFISIARINNGSFYRKMLIAEHITIYLSKYIVQKNWKLFWEVFKIHKNKIHFLLLSFVFIQIKKIQDRLDKG
jgi:hypothetical protein